MKAPTEYEIQVRLMSMIERLEIERGERFLRTATQGGVRVSPGTAAKMKRSGYKKGTPDILFFEPSACGKYHGLAIELKTMKGRPSPEQKEWIEKLNERGWSAHISKGFDATAEIIADYFGMSIPPFC